MPTEAASSIVHGQVTSEDSTTNAMKATAHRRAGGDSTNQKTAGNHLMAVTAVQRSAETRGPVNCAAHSAAAHRMITFPVSSAIPMGTARITTARAVATGRRSKAQLVVTMSGRTLAMRQIGHATFHGRTAHGRRAGRSHGG